MLPPEKRGHHVDDDIGIALPGFACLRDRSGLNEEDVLRVWEIFIDGPLQNLGRLIMGFRKLAEADQLQQGFVVDTLLILLFDGGFDADDLVSLQLIADGFWRNRPVQNFGRFLIHEEMVRGNLSLDDALT